MKSLSSLSTSADHPELNPIFLSQGLPDNNTSASTHIAPRQRIFG
jgi:hypothetical protein